MNVSPAAQQNSVSAASIIVGKTYRLNKKIGEGSFGKIYMAEHKDNCKEQYAIKLITKENHQTLFENEILMYERLKGSKYIPSLYASGSEGKYNYFVMPLLEQNLEQLRASYGAQMNMKAILHLGVEMLNALEFVHDIGILHRDIKPANFLLKTNQQNISELYLIDFGLAGLYYYQDYQNQDHKHIPMKTGEKLLGTSRYMSVNVQQGFTAGRRDDVESLGYILIFLQKGELPWQGSGEMSQAIKQTFGWAYASNIVGEFILFNQYCRNLPFSNKPNYEYLRNVLTNLSQSL